MPLSLNPNTQPGADDTARAEPRMAPLLPGACVAGLESRITASKLERLLTHIYIGEGERERIPVRAPFTGTVFGSIPACAEEDVEAAVRVARAAQPAWAAKSFRERESIFLRFHDLLLDRREEVLDLIQLETGKARRHAFEELFDTAINARYYAIRAKKILRARRRKGALPLLTLTRELREPFGVVGVISPWNYPLNLAVTDAIPALMAGNTAVLKPDHQTTFTALWAVDLLREAGLPTEVMPVLAGEGPQVGPWLGDRVDFLMFTGSTRTGRIVARQAAERLIPCSLELGGKNPMIVLADANLEDAVDGAVRGAFVGAGQNCVSIERLYVQRPVLQPFLESFAERTRKMKLGAALDYSIEMGSLTSERQLATVEDHVRDAVEKGATVVCGGRHRPDLGPLFYEPTILTGVREGMKLYAEETFGPVVSVYPVDTEEEALERANSSNYGFNTSIWTHSGRKGAHLAGMAHTGSVNVNEAYGAVWASVEAPIGGMKQSGLGRRHGEEGILRFTQVKTVAVQRLLPAAPPRFMDAGVHAEWLVRLLRLVRHTRLLGY